MSGTWTRDDKQTSATAGKEGPAEGFPWSRQSPAVQPGAPGKHVTPSSGGLGDDDLDAIVVPQLFGHQVFCAVVRRDGTRVGVNWGSPKQTRDLLLKLLEILWTQDPMIAKALVDHLKQSDARMNP